MKSSLLFLPLLACATVQPEAPRCPAPAPAPFQVIGEARMALVDSYDLMIKDVEAQRRVAILDYILMANSNFLIGHDPHYERLAACTTAAIVDVLPDMAVFASPDNTARVRRAHEMFAAMGGTCAEQMTAPVKAPSVTEDEVIEQMIQREGEPNESLELGPASR